MKKFKSGDRIIVTAEHIQSYEQIGTILNYYSPTSCKICFDNWNGLGRKELAIKEIYLERYEDNMAAVKGNYKVAMVKFLEGVNTTKDYAFALFDDTIKKDDYVLVDTTRGFSVGKVSEVKSQVDYDGVTVTKEVVCKVDFSDFEKRKENRKKKDALKKRMDAMIKDNQEVVLYEMLAKTNPDMAEMLKEYKELSNV